MSRNASHRQHVDRAERRLKHERQRELNDLRTVLATPPGRRFLYRLVTRLRPDDRLWEASNELLAYKAARADVAVELLNAIQEADPDAWLRMLMEAREREKTMPAVDDRPETEPDSQSSEEARDGG